MLKKLMSFYKNNLGVITAGTASIYGGDYRPYNA